MNWEPIAGAKSGDTNLFYKGHFNGMGHTIKGLNVTKTVSIDVKLGPYDDGSYVNLTYAGSGLFAFAGDFALLDTGPTDLVYVSDLRVEGSVNVKGPQPISVMIGGIVGQTIAGGLSGCTSDVKLNAELPNFTQELSCGGGVGFVMQGSLPNCVNEGSITVSIDKAISSTAPIHIGGVVGMIMPSDISSQKELANCINRGEVVYKGSGAIVGGVAGGMGEGRPINSINLGNVKAGKNSFAGGICGDTGGNDALNVLNLGVITAESGSYLGGITPGRTTEISGRHDWVAIYNAVNIGEVRPASSDADKAGSLVGIYPGSQTYGGSGCKLTNCAYIKSGDQKPVAIISPSGVSLESKDLLVLPEASKDMAIVTLSVAPQVLRLAPGETGSFDIMFNNRPATSDEVGRYITSLDITAVSSEIAEISADGAHLIVTAKKDGFTNAKLKGWFHAASFAEGANFAPISHDTDKTDTYVHSADIGMGILVETKKAPESPSGSSSGCSAGFAALALLAVIPVVLKRKK